MVIPATSTEYMHVPVTPPAGVDITGTPPEVAILPVSNKADPVPGDWRASTWTDGTVARLLIGPNGGAVTLPVGEYRVWVHVDPPGAEDIVRPAGYLGIT